jgi:hypothetical protein
MYKVVAANLYKLLGERKTMKNLATFSISADPELTPKCRNARH